VAYGKQSRKRASMTKYCCGAMTRHLEMECADHPDTQDCSDRVLKYSSVFNEYSLIIHDGGSSSYTIRYCPFCGAKLPASRRES